MLQTRYRFLASPLLCLLVLSSLVLSASGQTTSPGDTKLTIKAVLILTPEFCATESKKGDFWSGKETFQTGKAACSELEPALRGVFSNLTRVEAPPSSGEAQLVLLPRFVDTGATKTLGAFSDREMVVLLEWTLKDKSGKTVWIETVQGSAKHHMGNAFTYKKNRKMVVEDSVKDAAEQSASKMSASPELRKLSAASSTSAIGSN